MGLLLLCIGLQLVLNVRVVHQGKGAATQQTRAASPVERLIEGAKAKPKFTPDEAGLQYLSELAVKEHLDFVKREKQVSTSFLQTLDTRLAEREHIVIRIHLYCLWISQL